MGSQAIKVVDQLRAQWYWKSNSDSWSTNGNEEWTKYADIESAIIEEAFNRQNKTKLAELENYWINLNDCIQISKSDPNEQRQIKWVITSRNESQGLREERFFLPPALSKTFNDDHGKQAYIFLSHWKKDKELSDVEIVEQAANGIIIEGKQLGQHCNSQYIARQLIAQVVISSSSNEHYCGESEMSSGGMEHVGDTWKV
ncbi:unnamed protein product [Didymodactylos carnosus]|uniref:WWE domain-containing protein n=1 Tax=Didymodactylos carnosus TaxID=1234261 RepID=A0A8S2ETV4_9BILA|nr:unnamed protein product [Didymodactylos carnosus]CAF4115139.1 unnamed protein product [Didymodactylos carnosus]